MLNWLYNMNETLRFFLLFFALIFAIAVVIGFCVLALKVFLAIRDTRDRRKYPKYLSAIQIYNKLIYDECEQYNRTIAPLKREIDSLESKKKYLPKDELCKLEVIIEEKKVQLFQHQSTHDLLCQKSNNYYNKEVIPVAIEEDVPYAWCDRKLKN